MDSWMKLLGVIVFYLVYQQIENSYLTPHIMKSTVELPAVSVIVALAGIPGAIIAVPTAALIATIVDEYVEDKNVEPSGSEQHQQAA
jgi:predicted PurR-regulated permease PerM